MLSSALVVLDHSTDTFGFIIYQNALGDWFLHSHSAILKGHL